MEVMSIAVTGAAFAPVVFTVVTSIVAMVLMLPVVVSMAAMSTVEMDIRCAREVNTEAMSTAVTGQTFRAVVSMVAMSTAGMVTLFALAANTGVMR